MAAPAAPVAPAAAPAAAVPAGEAALLHGTMVRLMERVCGLLSAVQAGLAPCPAMVFNDHAWVSPALVDVALASSAVVASFAYDLPEIHAALLGRLAAAAAGGAPFRLLLLVDSEQFQRPSCRMMVASVRALAEAHAEVRVGTGKSAAQGCMHMKSMVLDNLVLYLGSGNYTENSTHHSWNQAVRLTGAQVQVPSSVAMPSYSGR